MIEINDEFIEKYTKMIKIILIKRFNITNKYDIEDFTQECLIKIIENIDSYNPEKAKIQTYISVICYNLIIDILRKRKNENAISMDITSKCTYDYDNIFMTAKLELDDEEWELFKWIFIYNETTGYVGKLYKCNKSTISRKIKSILNKLKDATF